MLAGIGEQKPAGRYAYIAPLYSQAKGVAWDYLLGFTDGLGGVANQAELRVDVPALDFRVRLYGADNPDSLRGLYFDGVILDEFADMRDGVWEKVIRPALSDRRGWATFIGTPKGRNEFCKLYEDAADDPEWSRFMLKASETGILPESELAELKRQMSADAYAQEYECSFEAAIAGAYYGKLMREADEDGRITRVPYDPALPVETWWDLGIRDPTAIWFVQSLRSGEIRCIEYYESTDLDLPDYFKLLDQRPYNYSRHIAPHDIRVRELGTGKSRLEMAAEHGIHFDVAQNIEVEDGIEAAKVMLPRCWFDKEKCGVGLEALRQYRADYNDKMRTFQPKPRHDWASHGADAFRMGAVAQPPVSSRPLEYRMEPIF